MNDLSAPATRKDIVEVIELISDFMSMVDTRFNRLEKGQDQLKKEMRAVQKATASNTDRIDLHSKKFKSIKGSI